MQEQFTYKQDEIIKNFISVQRNLWVVFESYALLLHSLPTEIKDNILPLYKLGWNAGIEKLKKLYNELYGEYITCSWEEFRDHFIGDSDVFKPIFWKGSAIKLLYIFLKLSVSEIISGSNLVLLISKNFTKKKPLKPESLKSQIRKIREGKPDKELEHLLNRSVFSKSS